MTAFEVDRQDPASFFRREVQPADLARAQREWDIQHQEAVRGAMIGFTVFAAIAILLVLSVFIHRRKIVRAADQALVSGVATGVRAARAVRSSRAAWVGRVLAKADEKTTRPD